MTVKLKPLAEQVIVITGASSGIGLATARVAAERGAAVLLVARNARALREAVHGIREKGGRADFAVADVGDAAAVEDAADKAVELFGRIDSWVNNAGIAIYATLLDTPLAEHEQLFRTNYFGVVNGTNAAIARMRDTGGGALITVGSIGSDLPTPVLSAYAASKHAVKGYVESLRIEATAQELPFSITLIKPSGIDTPIGQHSANHGEGEAVIPPPLYHPRLVADAILDAAVHPRREITVGGAGRAQVLTGVHFPRLLEKLGSRIIPAAWDRTKPKTESDSLFTTDETHGGEERGGAKHARRFSLYTEKEMHPVAAAAIGLGLVAGVGGLVFGLARLRSRKED